MRLPSPTASAGIGGGLGAALGGMLGAPGASIRSLLDGLTGGQGGEDGSALMRMLPGLLAAAGGGLAAASGAGIPLAMLAASGLGGLGQAVGEASGDSSFDPISGKDLGAKFGASLGDAGGMGLEMALDPTTYAGGLGGRAVGTAVERRAAGGAAHALEAAAVPSTAVSAAANEGRAGVGAAKASSVGGSTIEQAASHTPTSGTRNSWEAFMDESSAASKAGYRPDVVSASPDFLHAADPSKLGKAYKQVNPQMGEELSLMGYANPTGNTSATLNAGQIPAWAESRGGWLMPTKERMAAQADAGAGASMLRNPGAMAKAGPKIDAAAGYEGLMSQKVGPSPSLNPTAEDLMSPAEKFAKMRKGVPGLEGELRGHSPLASALDETSVDAWLKRRSASRSSGRY